MARAIFYTHQTSGECAGACVCDRTHQMEKTGLGKKGGGVFLRGGGVYPHAHYGRCLSVNITKFFRTLIL